MGAGMKWKQIRVSVPLAVSLLCAGSAAADTATPAPAHHPKTQIHNQKKTAKKTAPLPPLANGPTGPVQQIPLDAIAAVPPQVTYQNNQLTIVAPNSTLAEILRAVRKQTGAEIEVPSASERVVTHLGPGPAREVMAELLNGSKFNYVLLGSAVDDSVLTRVVLVAKSREATVANNPPGAEPPPPGTPQPVNIAARQPQDDQAEQNEPDAEDAADDNAEPAAAEVQPVQPDQPARTPQQMLQEMQQRQMQMQPGQPPFPGGFPGRQPQQQDPQ